MSPVTRIRVEARHLDKERARCITQRRDNLIDVRIVEDDGGGLATELKRRACHMSSSSSHDVHAGWNAARDSDHVDAFMPDQVLGGLGLCGREAEWSPGEARSCGTLGKDSRESAATSGSYSSRWPGDW